MINHQYKPQYQVHWMKYYPPCELLCPDNDLVIIKVITSEQSDLVVGIHGIGCGTIELCNGLSLAFKFGMI